MYLTQFIAKTWFIVYQTQFIATKEEFIIISNVFSSLFTSVMEKNLSKFLNGGCLK